jgi:predicted lipoprotein with Yx(FWY)xxD motif
LNVLESREEPVNKLTLASILPITLALAVAACGSSSNKSTSSSAASKPAASTSTPTTSSTAASANQAALITTKKASKLGTIVAYGPQKLTVYLFEADKGSSSSCTGACTHSWPPITGTPQAGGGAVSSDLGTITRPDGTKQVTYKGHPLYLFVKDKDDGDTYGQGVNEFGANWYTLSASGNKVDLS